MSRVVVLVSPWSSCRFVVSPSAREPGRWQLTRFDGDEPTGHTTWDSAEDATASARGRWVNRQPPVGDCTFAEPRP
jgi:hypothetical protein